MSFFFPTDRHSDLRNFRFIIFENYFLSLKFGLISHGLCWVWFLYMRTQRFCRIMILFIVFPSLKLGIRDFKAKSRQDSGLKVCARAGDGMAKINLGITGSVGL